MARESGYLRDWIAARLCPTIMRIRSRFGVLDGDLNLIVLGGEVVSDYSLRLKKQYGFENTWVAAYSNDVFGYVGSRRVIHEGGYEGGGANTNFPAPFSEAVEDLIVEKVGDLMRGTL